MVWFPILGENRLGQFRMVMNAAPAIRDAEICPIIPHPSRDLRRAEKLLIEYKPEPRGHRPRRKTGGWGFEPHALTIAPAPREPKQKLGQNCETDRGKFHCRDGGGAVTLGYSSRQLGRSQKTLPNRFESLLSVRALPPGFSAVSEPAGI
jgi:hypothetical protein